ncbi:MFS transporter [Corynebacterium choanae]|uniref:Tetracycline resistance protein, class C n=1 Tax=Corynebacterium choanae TaxID=1862358 RepID=A0A3G6J9Z8_9CORY|nr:MFS transporter [Corynebacterium choanae]AZA13280.1 Tetracycline resistance protein, class C [Corynebacterium choanae]
MTKEHRRRPQQLPQEIWVLVTAAFIIALGFGLIAPIIPQFALSFDVSVTLAGLVVSIFAFSRLIFAPTAGKLVEVIGSRKVYLTGLLTVAVATGLIAWAQTYWQMLLLRGIAGIGSTMFTVSAVGLIVRISPPAIRGYASSTYGTAFLVGSVIGPVVGAALAPLGMRWPFAIYATALFLAAAVVGWKLSSQRLYDLEHNTVVAPMTIRQALQHRAYRASLLSGFANGWTNFGVRIALLPLLAAATFSQGAALAGVALAVFAAGNALALQVAGRGADKWGRKPLMLIGLLVNGLMTITLGWVGNPLWFVLATAGAGVGAGLFVPAQQATVADVIGNERSGARVLSRFQMVQDFGSLIGPIAVGLIVDHGGYSLAFAVSGAMMFLAALGWLLAPETMPSPQPAMLLPQVGAAQPQPRQTMQPGSGHQQK